jgi:opacity protein-like surface antigen
MRRLAIVPAAIALVLALPSVSRAQGYLVPNIGWDFGGSAGNCPSLLNDCQEKRLSYGVTFGALAGGIFGVEGDVGYAPDFFGDSASFGTNNVLTAMGNLVIAIPAGPVRPFVAGGVGLIRTRLDQTLNPGAGNIDEDQFGYNFGGGVMFLLPHHLGFRGDIRYYRTVSDISVLGISLIEKAAVNFTRVTIGLVIH